MVVASKALALTAIDLFATPSLVQAARADFDRKLTGKTYHTFIPAGQKPPLSYRDN
jgi:aminobenzoyl-glutamate utilization protein B